jgi:hypothetical protein
VASPITFLEESAPAQEIQQTSSVLAKSQREELEAEVLRAESLVASRDDLEAYYSKETLERGIAFLKMHMEGIWKSCGTTIILPTIGPGPRGSVDLYWKTTSFELLVNIPASPNDLGTFYGRDYNQQTAKGSFDPKRFTLSIASWLMT